MDMQVKAPLRTNKYKILTDTSDSVHITMYKYGDEAVVLVSSITRSYISQVIRSKALIDLIKDRLTCASLDQPASAIKFSDARDRVLACTISGDDDVVTFELYMYNGMTLYINWRDIVTVKITSLLSIGDSRELISCSTCAVDNAPSQPYLGPKPIRHGVYHLGELISSVIGVITGHDGEAIGVDKTNIICQKQQVIIARPCSNESLVFERAKQ